MPVILESTYTPPRFLKNSHLQSIYHKLLRTSIDVNYNRERVTLSDGDFIDIDWIKNGNKKVAILVHGLESSSDVPYIKGMAHTLSKAGWDIAAYNLRGCSGILNAKFRAYFSGDYQDLIEVVRHVTKQHKYTKIDLVGFSLGGNIVLRYAGFRGENIPPVINKIATISVPCDLKASAYHLAKKGNRFYMNRFIKSMKKKLKLKLKMFPNELPKINLNTLKDFKSFDDYYTAPAHGFPDAHTYWETCSSKFHIHKIKVPTLILNAADDQFLPNECYPIKEANQNKFVSLEIPDFGGHVGFIAFNKKNEYWHETQVKNFLKDS